MNNKYFSLEAEGEIKKKNLFWLKLKHILPPRQFNKSFFRFISSKTFCLAQKRFFHFSIKPHILSTFKPRTLSFHLYYFEVMFYSKKSDLLK